MQEEGRRPTGAGARAGRGVRPAAADPAGGAAALPAPAGRPDVQRPAPAQPAQPVEVESKDLLAREPAAARSVVRHVLVGWKDLPRAADPRAQRRTKEEADELALKILGMVREGINMESIMLEYSEDPGSAAAGTTYTVEANGQFVPEFEALSLRLQVGEAGITQTVFGHHVIKRIE